MCKLAHYHSLQTSRLIKICPRPLKTSIPPKTVYRRRIVRWAVSSPTKTLLTRWTSWLKTALSAYQGSTDSAYTKSRTSSTTSPPRDALAQPLLHQAISFHRKREPWRHLWGGQRSQKSTRCSSKGSTNSRTTLDRAVQISATSTLNSRLRNYQFARPATTITKRAASSSKPIDRGPRAFDHSSWAKTTLLSWTARSWPPPKYPWRLERVPSSSICWWVDWTHPNCRKWASTAWSWTKSKMRSASKWKTIVHLTEPTHSYRWQPSICAVTRTVALNWR